MAIIQEGGYQMTNCGYEHDIVITKNSNGTNSHPSQNGNAKHSHKETEIDIPLDQTDTSRIYKEPSNSEAKSQHTVTFTHHRNTTRKCCLLFFIFIIIVAILATGVYFIVQSLEKTEKSKLDSAMLSSEMKGSNLQKVLEYNRDLASANIPQLGSQVEGQFTILDLKYSKLYADRDSQSSKSLSNYLESKLNQLYKESQLSSHFDQSIVIQFTAGSIVPHFQLIFLKEFDSEELEDLAENIFKQGTTVRDGKTYFGKHLIEASSVDFEAIPKTKNINTTTTLPLSSPSLTTTTAATTTSESSTHFIENESSTLVPLTNSIQDITTESSQLTYTDSADYTSTVEQTTTDWFDYTTTETNERTTAEAQEETTTVGYEITTSEVFTTEQNPEDTTIEEVTTASTTTTPRPCSQIVLDYCSDRSQVPYTDTIFPNYFGHESIVDILTMAKLEPIANSNCHPYVQRFMCSLAAPKCVQGVGQRVPPCRQLCTEVFQKCTKGVPQLMKDSNIDCSMFPEEGTAECVGAPELPTVPVRLVAGAGSFEGRVEVYHEGEWGTVCSEGWDDHDASIICKQLNLTDNGRARLNAYFAEGSSNQSSVLTKVNCTGQEDHLALCGEIQWTSGGQACDHSKDAGVTCDVPNKVVSNIQYRLTGGPRPSEGIVELYYNGEWGTICDDSFDIDEEMREYSVICRMFNYTEYATKASNEQYTTDTKTIWLDNVFCGETENNIVLCNHGGWGKHNCRHSEDVAVMCEPPIQEITTSSIENGTGVTSSPEPVGANIRLSGGLDPANGAVEVFFEGSWGGICPGGLSQASANLICQLLGYTNITATFLNEAFVTDDNQTQFSKVRFSSISCLGNESNIFDCPYNLWSSDVHCNKSHFTMISCLGDIAPPLHTTIHPTETKNSVGPSSTTSHPDTTATETQFLSTDPATTDSTQTISAEESTAIDVSDFHETSEADIYTSSIPDTIETATDTNQFTTNQEPNLVTTAESQEGSCEAVSISLCKSNLPYSLTKMPNWLNDKTQEEALAQLKTENIHHLLTECPDNMLLFICAMAAPKCEIKENLTTIFRPCRSLCQEARDGCEPLMNGYNIEWKEEWNCNVLPVREAEMCFDPYATDIPPSPDGDVICHKIEVPICSHNLAYNQTFLPNLLNQTTQKEAADTTHQWALPLSFGCHRYLRPFLCSLYSPDCHFYRTNNYPLIPCMEICLEIKKSCQDYILPSWPSILDCHIFPAKSNGSICTMFKVSGALEKTVTPAAEGTIFESSTDMASTSKALSRKSRNIRTGPTDNPSDLINNSQTFTEDIATNADETQQYDSFSRGSTDDIWSSTILPFTTDELSEYTTRETQTANTRNSQEKIATVLPTSVDTTSNDIKRDHDTITEAPSQNTQITIQNIATGNPALVTNDSITYTLDNYRNKSEKSINNQPLLLTRQFLYVKTSAASSKLIAKSTPEALITREKNNSVATALPSGGSMTKLVEMKTNESFTETMEKH